MKAQSRVRNVLYYLRNIVTVKPDKLAFSDGITSLTFRDLYNRACSIGSYLHNNMIYKRPVVVFMRKSPYEVSAFFGVISGGCYYVPIDEEMPRDRIQLILDNVQSPLVICDDDTISVAKNFNISNGNIVVTMISSAPK